MAYMVYLGTMLLPIFPSKLELKINNQNDTMVLINEGEVNLLKKAALTDISFEVMLPNVPYPFAVYKNGFRPAAYFMEELERLKTNRQPFQFIVTRTMPGGRMLFDTNMKVSLEDYTLTEEAENGFDMMVSISLKQYRAYGTKTCKITVNQSKTQVSVQNQRDSTASGTARTYTVVRGDSLWNIAKKLYGNGAKYTAIYNANKDKIKNPNLIYPGQILIIPAV